MLPVIHFTLIAGSVAMGEIVLRGEEGDDPEMRLLRLGRSGVAEEEEDRQESLYRAVHRS